MTPEYKKAVQDLKSCLEWWEVSRYPVIDNNGPITQVKFLKTIIDNLRKRAQVVVDLSGVVDNE